MATHSELNEDQYRLLRAFNDLAEGGPTNDVAANDAARMAEFDPHSREFVAVLSYLVDVGHLVGIGDERYRITLEDIHEVQRRPQLQDAPYRIPAAAPPVQARASRASDAAERPHSLP